MCRIKVKVSELYEQVKLMKDDGMVYVTLSIFEEEPMKIFLKLYVLKPAMLPILLM